jgi:putative restriction endonuclease
VAFWWVNQGQTWQEEIEGEFLWAPRLGKHGQQVPAYHFMTVLATGDIVFSYFKQALRFCGVVVGGARPSARPNFQFSNDAWNDDGWSVEMRYLQLRQPIDPKADLDFFQAHRPGKYSPINSKGTVQTQYLFPLPDVIGERYLLLAGIKTALLQNLLEAEPSAEVVEFEDALPGSSTSIMTPTERQALGRARIGQGFFKEQVRKFEPACRLTGVDEPRRLIASHMKPWRDSSNPERLDGANGLMLSPHVDHLFDRGLISFRDNGTVLASPSLEATVVSRWKLDLEVEGKPFTAQQRPYLEFHRDVVFVN